MNQNNDENDDDDNNDSGDNSDSDNDNTCDEISFKYGNHLLLMSRL